MPGGNPVQAALGGEKYVSTPGAIIEFVFKL